VRTLASRNVSLDRYLAAERQALSPEARHGLELFQGKVGCVQYHNGPLLSDGGFSNLGLPDNGDIVRDSLRRVTLRRFYKTLGVPAYHTLETDVELYVITTRPEDRGKFRTPSLREVAHTAGPAPQPIAWCTPSPTRSPTERVSSSTKGACARSARAPTSVASVLCPLRHGISSDTPVGGAYTRSANALGSFALEIVGQRLP
jgi:hypothetical protein